jgi:ubiquinone/menaquinone biosynthesis C-methylase UbiE
MKNKGGNPMGLFDRLLRRGETQKQHPVVASEPAPHPEAARVEVIDGREMRADAPYALPKDLQEINRLDFQHFLLRNALHSNYVAPLTHPKAVLDVGCGTGRWCYEMAQEFPEALVMGCDLTEPAADVRVEVPANYQFVQADVLKPLPFADQSFEYVHQRLLFLALPGQVWPREIRELVRITRLGGWVELIESQMALQHAGEYTTQMSTWMNRASQLRGLDPWQAPPLERYLSNAGLQQVTRRVIELPLGSWGGHIGTMMATNIENAILAMKPLAIARLGLDEAYFEQVRTGELEEWNRLQVTVPFFLTYGQRVKEFSVW